MCLQIKLEKNSRREGRSCFDYPSNRMQLEIHNRCRSVKILDIKVALDIYVTAVASMYGGDVASTSTWTVEKKDMTL